MKRLERETVLITGAGRGIGRAVALAMAGEGANLVLNDLGGDEWGDGADRSPALFGGTAVRVYRLAEHITKPKGPDDVSG